MSKRTDLEVLAQGKPFLRSVLAFLLFMRAPAAGQVDDFYKVADEFIDRLEKDLER